MTNFERALLKTAEELRAGIGALAVLVMVLDAIAFVALVAWVLS